MHSRFLSWLFLGALVATVSLRAQAPATSASSTATAAMPAGLVLVAKTDGTVTMTVNGTQTPVKQGMEIPQAAKINTGLNSSVVLVFSNGAQTHLAADGELIIEEFLQDPFAATVKVAEMDDEPSASRARLALNRGELVGHVKKLNKAKDSSFTVQTPVGAAGIRGTTFRIVFRPTGDGRAYTFTLTTQVGDVGFTQNGSGGTSTPGATTDPTAATVTGSGTGTGLSVPQGQEIVMVVDVSTNAQGQLVVTALPPAPTQTTTVPTATMQAVTTVAVEVAVAVQNTVFTPAPPSPSGGAAASTGLVGTVTASTTSASGPTTTTATVGGATTTGETVIATIVKTTTPPPAPEPVRIPTTNPGP